MIYIYKPIIIAFSWFLSAGFAQVHFTFNSNTGNNATIAVPVDSDPNINGIPLVAGDEIGVFTPSGLCVGAVVWNNKNTSITVWGDDVQTTEIDGILPGEEMKFRLWQFSENTEYDSVFAAYSFGDGIYNVNGIYILSELIAYSSQASALYEVLDPSSKETKITADVYPNPFNSTTKYQINSDYPLTINIIVWDILGKKKLQFDNRNIFRGRNEIDLSLNAFPSGIYFITAQIINKSKKQNIQDKNQKLLVNKVLLIK